MVRAKRIYSKAILLTYATDFGDVSFIDKIDLKCKKLNCKYLLVKSQGDKTISHEHFHVLLLPLDNKDILSKSTTSFDIKLDESVYSFRIEDELHYLKKSASISDINRAKSTCNEFKLIDIAHPNYKPYAEYGSIYDMFEYCLEQSIDTKANFNWEEEIEIYKKEKENKQFLFDKSNNKMIKPDFDDLKKRFKGNFQGCKAYLKENFTNFYVYQWSRISSAVNDICKHDEEQFKPFTGEYWIDNKLLHWIANVLQPYVVNQKNSEWQKNHRNDRPQCVCWIGKKETGKTGFCRTICENNYFLSKFDNWDDFDDRNPVCIIDDFNSEWDKIFPDWKMWVGAQTDFTINPKCEKRFKLKWGHPTIFLMNKPYVLSDPEDMAYCQRMLFINNDDRNLWEKGQDKSFLLTHSKIDIDELKNQLIEGKFKFDINTNSSNKLEDNIKLLEDGVGDSNDMDLENEGHHIPTEQEMLDRLNKYFNN